MHQTVFTIDHSLPVLCHLRQLFLELEYNLAGPNLTNLLDLLIQGISSETEIGRA